MKKSKDVLMVGSPVRYPDIRYATGFFSFSPVIFLRTKKGQYLVVSPLDVGHARRIIKKTQILSSADLPVATDSKTPTCDRIISLLKEKNIRAINVPPYFPLELARQIGRKKIGLSIVKGTPFPEREIKTAEELEYIAHAQKAAVKAMDAAITMISEAKISADKSLRIRNRPLTSEAVRDMIDHTARNFDCICYETIVAGGKQAVNPHETGWGTLKADKPIVIDIFPQHIKSGYWGDLTRTVVRGTPSPEIKRMYSAVRDAQRAAISNIKAGVPAGKIHNTAVDLFNERGFFTGARNGKQVGFIHSIGHGIGLEIHENPSVGPAETKLKKGSVITVEPGLYYHEHGAIRIEDIVLVTRAAGRILVPCDYPFVV